MDVTPLIPVGRQIIQSYAGGSFKISGHHYTSAVMVLPDETCDWDFNGAPEDLSVDSFCIVQSMADELDVVLVGTGDHMVFIPGALRDALKQRGITIDVMDTGAACRTYNVLMAEGRRVVALLLPFGKTQND